MKSLSAISVLLVCSALAAAASPWSGRAESAFVSGGTVKMDLGGAGYNIKPGASDKIVVSYTVGEQEDLDRARATIKVNGSVANIRVSGPHNEFEVVIEVPARSDLFIRQSAGDLTVGNIRGNKDIECHAGEVNIAVNDPSEYGHVDGSVMTGDLEAPMFHVSTGGLFRSFKKVGTGEFRLHAHVGAGDLNFVANETALKILN